MGCACDGQVRKPAAAPARIGRVARPSAAMGTRQPGSNQALLRSMRLQAKLDVGASGDPREHEAERMADAVTASDLGPARPSETAPLQPLGWEDDAREARQRCRKMGCQLVEVCDDGRKCAVSDCGHGKCSLPICDKLGFNKLPITTWCVYRCAPNGAAFTIRTFFGAKFGPYCVD